MPKHPHTNTASHNAFAFDQVMVSETWDPLVDSIVEKICQECNFSPAALNRLDKIAMEILRIKHRLKHRMVGEPIQLEEIKL